MERATGVTLRAARSLAREYPFLFPAELFAIENAGIPQAGQALQRLEAHIRGDRLLGLLGSLPAAPQAAPDLVVAAPPAGCCSFRRLIGKVAHRLMSERLVAGDEQGDQDERRDQPARALGGAPPEDEEDDHG